MRRADAAELILSLVTSPERATAIAGDLLEDAERAGSFWLAVARTAAGQLWGQLATNRTGLGRAILRTFLMTLGFVMLGVVLMFVGLFCLIAVLKVGFGRDLPAMGSPAITVLFYVGVNIAVGRRIARRWPGRECLVSFSFVLVMHGIALAAELAFWIIQRYGGSGHAEVTITPLTLISWDGDLARSLLASGADFVTDFLTLVGGAVYERSKSMRSTIA